MLLYLIRHGETDWNALKKIQGRVDTPLNEEGIRLAEVTAKQLADVEFHWAITSPLQRARKTAEIILGNRKVPLELEERLMEIDFGELEGMTLEHLEESHPFFDFFSDAYHYVPQGGGESIAEVCTRTNKFFRELIGRKELQDKTILVATHGCTLRGILQNVYENASDFWHGGVCPNCGVNIIEVKNKKAVLLESDKIYY